MNAKNKLLDKARETCSLPLDKDLAVRMGVSAQLISNWRKNHQPMPDERIAQTAKLAHEDPALWLAAIRAEQSEGATARAWSEAAKRLGYAACLILALGQAGVAKATTAGLSELRIMYSLFRRRFAF